MERADPHVSHDPLRLRRIFAAYPSGVTVVAAMSDGSPIGLTANSFTTVSLTPALVSVCVAHSSTTWPALRQLGRIGVSVLSAQQEHVARRLSGPASDRFAADDWRATDAGAVLIEGSSAWLECEIDQVVEAGDHDIVVLRIIDLDGDPDVAPLVFHGSQFRRLHP